MLFKQAIRSLLRDPKFFASVTLALAVGLALATSVFTAVHSAVFESLPYPHADRLVVLSEKDNSDDYGRASYAAFLNWQGNGRSIAGIAACRGWLPTLTGAGEPSVLIGVRVSADFFHVLGAPILIGHDFSQQDDRPEADYSVILSESLWRQRFGGDASLVGKSILLNGKAFLVRGVLANKYRTEGAGFLDRPDVWAPLAYTGNMPQACRSCRHLLVLGRIRPEFDRDSAAAELTGLLRYQALSSPRDYGKDPVVTAVSLKDSLYGSVRRLGALVFAGVVLLLVITCANVASLFLIRSASSRKSCAIRAALGGSRAQVLLYPAAEVAVVAVAGCILGLGFAWMLTPALHLLEPLHVPRIGQATLGLTSVLVALGATLASFLLVAVPSVLMLRGELLSSLREDSRTTDSRHGRFTRDALVVFEVTLATILVFGGSLLVRSFLNLSNVRPGFDSSRILTLTLDVLGSKAAIARQVPAFYRDVLSHIGALPGVRSAAAVSILPIAGSFDRYRICIEDGISCESSDAPQADRFVVTPNYLNTMGISLLEGRDFNDDDRMDSLQVAIVGETLAKRIWSGSNPLGKRIRIGQTRTWRSIVGVAADVRSSALSVAPGLEIYVPHDQQPQTAMTLTVKLAPASGNLEPAIRAQVHAVDKNQPIFRVLRMEDVLSRSTSQQRYAMWFIGGFGGGALLLAALGIYGVLSYFVKLRTRELGIRLALGADSGSIIRLVVGRGMLLVALGLCAGALGGVALSRTLAGLLYGVASSDPIAVAMAASLLIAVAASACYFPGRRASKVDPVQALRFG